MYIISRKYIIINIKHIILQFPTTFFIIYKLETINKFGNLKKFIHRELTNSSNFAIITLYYYID